MARGRSPPLPQRPPEFGRTRSRRRAVQRVHLNEYIWLPPERRDRAHGKDGNHSLDRGRNGGRGRAIMSLRASAGSA
eukprot:4355509-Prymnesium_polylepis.2